MRLIAAIPDAPQLEVSADDRIIFPKLSYRTVTQYLEMPEKEFTFQIHLAGESASAPLAIDREGLHAGKHYTLVAFGNSNGKVTLAAFSDDLTPPPSGKAKVRIINAAPEAGEVDIYAVGKDTLFIGVSSGSDSSYTEVEPAEVTLEVRPKGKETALLDLEHLQFDSGGVYTVVIIGGPRQIAPQLAAIRIEDRMQGVASAQLR